MQTDALRPPLWREVTFHSIGDHGIEFGKRITLGRDAASARRIPTRNETARFGARLNLKGYFAHGEKTSPRLTQGQFVKTNTLAHTTEHDELHGKVDFQDLDLEECVHGTAAIV